MSDWLLILGAGSSAPPPSSIPTFEPLAQSILRELGWKEVLPPEAIAGGKTTATDPPRRTWAREDRPAFPTISPRRLPPEVVFGVLHRYGVPFTKGIRAFFGHREPNAVHVIAANVLRDGGPVWTTNVDRLVEDACAATAHRGAPFEPERFFRVAARKGDSSIHGSLDRPMLVKFHGTIDHPRSLAFADLQLLTPLAGRDVEHLVELAKGRRVVVHGYAGLDLDLQRGLRAALDAADDVRWFEPNEKQRAAIRSTFGDLVQFVPSRFANADLARQETGEAFLVAADHAGLTSGLSDELREFLTGARPDTRARPTFSLGWRRAPGIVHARLVERFGNYTMEGAALRMARREDALRLRVDTLPAHVRWALAYSLYHGGIVARTIRCYLARPRLLSVPGTGWPRNRAFDKGTALMLADGDWAGLDTITQLAYRSRATAAGTPLPSDCYYRAYALRYQFRVAEAREQAAAAEAGLEGSTYQQVDAERLAGAILEQGILDLYQGRFADALARGSDLHAGRGQYAIQRWAAWGHWLSGYAHAYRGEVDKARDAFASARSYFASEPLLRAMIDCDAGDRFTDRVALTLGHGHPHTQLPLDMGAMSPRQHDDARLILADHRLATEDVAGARSLLETVLDNPSNEAARWSAELGMAEVRRLSGEAEPGFETIRAHARSVGGTLLEFQALLGQLRCGATTAEHVRSEALVRGIQFGPNLAFDRLLGAERPLLWLVT